MRLRREGAAALAPSDRLTILPAAIGMAIVAVGVLSLLRRGRSPQLPDESQRNATQPLAPPHQAAVVKAARRLNRACGVLAVSAW
jgi:hypothetical protein